MTAKKMVNLHAYKCEKMNVISKDFFQEWSWKRFYSIILKCNVILPSYTYVGKNIFSTCRWEYNRYIYIYIYQNYVSILAK
jgi:hypothetical protein